MKTEALLNNFVGKEIRDFLFPLNLIQGIYLNPKYWIRDNFIISNGLRSKFLTLFGTCFSITVCAFHIANMPLYAVTFSSVSFLLNRIVNLNIFTIGHSINCINSVKYSEHHVQLILSLQKVFQINNLDMSKMTNYTFFNWVYVLLISVEYLGIFISNNPTIEYYFSYNFLFGVFILIFDFNICYTIRIIKLIEIALLEWLKELQNGKKVDNTENNMYWKDMTEAYIQVLKAYKIYKMVFQDLVSP